MSRPSDEEALEDARGLVAMIVDLLAEQEWEVVSNLTSKRRLSAEQLEAAIRGLSIELVRTPAGGLPEIEVVRAPPKPATTPGKRPRRRFTAVAPLWTPSGKSLWVLELTVREVSGGFQEARTEAVRLAAEPGAERPLVAWTPPAPTAAEKAAAEKEAAKRAKRAERSGARRQDGRPRWKTRHADVVGRVPADAGGLAVRAGDVVAQVQLCLDDVRRQLEREEMSLSDIVDMTVRTTDFPAARAQAGALSRWQREHGAWDQVHFEVVDALEPPGAVVEVEVRASRSTLVAGQLPESTPNAPVPEHLRPAVRAELDALAHGERPDHLYWVEVDGETLVVQPEAIWEHRQTDAMRRDDGGWSVVLPLWTELGCPSDFTAEVEVDPTGVAMIHSVRVM